MIEPALREDIRCRELWWAATRAHGAPARWDVTLTQTGELLGTPLYMAPEQFQARRADAQTDQFSFCVALYQALYGCHPFRISPTGKR